MILRILNDGTIIDPRVFFFMSVVAGILAGRAFACGGGGLRIGRRLLPDMMRHHESVFF